MKKLAVVISGWHFPHGFYDSMAEQRIPKGWTVDFFVVAHRDPSFAKMPVLGEGLRADLDRKLYPKIISKEEIIELGYDYKEYPNTIGDWGNSNQWLAEHDYKEYDMFLFTHDDNLLLRYDLFETVCGKMYKDDWLILTNSVGVPHGSIRGSFEFFKREMLDKLGGKFDLSQTTLDRTGKNDNPDNWGELFDWNTTVYPLTDFMIENNLESKVIVFSSQYRVSIFCIEGERGLISNFQEMNRESEDAGLNWLVGQKII